MSEQTKEQRLAEEAATAAVRWTAHNGGDSPKVWIEVVRPLVDERDCLASELASETSALKAVVQQNEHARLVVTDLQAERDTLAAEVKRLKETAEHLGANLKTARADLAEAHSTIRQMAAAAVARENETARQCARADRLAAGIDALVERYSDLQRGAR